MPSFPAGVLVKLFYETTVSSVTLVHEHNFRVKMTSSPVPGTPLDALDLETRVLGSITVIDYINTYAPIIMDIFAPAANMSRAEVWAHEANSEDMEFVNAAVLDFDGTSAGGTVDSWYAMLTFRSIGGRPMKLTFLESSVTGSAQQLYPTGNVAVDPIFDFVLGDTSCHLAKDGSRPVAGLKLSAGQQEAVWRQRYRPG